MYTFKLKKSVFIDSFWNSHLALMWWSRILYLAHCTPPYIYVYVYIYIYIHVYMDNFSLCSWMTRCTENVRGVIPLILGDFAFGSWNFKHLALFTCQWRCVEFMITSSNGNIFCVTGPLCRESQRPVTRSFDVSFDLCLNKPLSNNCEGGDLRRHRAHYDVIVMLIKWCSKGWWRWSCNIGFYSADRGWRPPCLVMVVVETCT